MTNQAIIKANSLYLNQILQLVASYELTNLNKKEIAGTGFLVSGFSKTDYLEYLAIAEHFYLYLDNEKLAGFILAYTNRQIKADEWINNRIKQQESKAFVLIKQIVVDEKYKGKGIAKQLYRYLFDKMDERICYAVIVTEPLNLRSIKFHEKLGFKKVFEAIPPDGLKRGVWKKYCN